MANIIKGNFNQPFVTLYNEAVQDKELSARAKGVHAYLLSLPGDWVVRAKELHNHFAEGRDAIMVALNELVERTYVEKRENRDGGKFDGVTYIVYPLKYQRAIEMGLIMAESQVEAGSQAAQPKKPEKEEIPFKEIIEYLNDKAGTKFKHTAKGNQKNISGRWSEGYKVEDFKHVIDVKTEEWLGDEEMEKHLNPVTLFRPSHFEKYLNQKLKRKKATQFPFGPPKPQPQDGPGLSEEERRKMLEEAGID